MGREIEVMAEQIATGVAQMVACVMIGALLILGIVAVWRQRKAPKPMIDEQIEMFD